MSVSFLGGHRGKRCHANEQSEEWENNSLDRSHFNPRIFFWLFWQHGVTFHFTNLKHDLLRNNLPYFIIIPLRLQHTFTIFPNIDVSFFPPSLEQIINESSNHVQINSFHKLDNFASSNLQMVVFKILTSLMMATCQCSSFNFHAKEPKTLKAMQIGIQILPYHFVW